MSVPTFGWRTLKAAGEKAGSRLMPDGEDETRTFQVREGYSGWKKGLSFVRIWREGQGYTMIVLNGEDDIVATATGKKNAQVWTNAFNALRNKGYEVSE